MTFSNWSKILPWKIGTVDSQQTKKNRIISKSFCRGILAGGRGVAGGRTRGADKEQLYIPEETEGKFAR